MRRHKNEQPGLSAKDGAAIPNRRKHARKSSSSPGTLYHRQAVTECDLINLSYGGACVSCPDGIIPQIGQPVQIQFLDGSTAIGHVVWVSTQELGISFRDLVPDIFDRPDGTSSGRGLFTRIVSLQIAKQSK